MTLLTLAPPPVVDRCPDWCDLADDPEHTDGHHEQELHRAWITGTAVTVTRIRDTDGDRTVLRLIGTPHGCRRHLIELAATPAQAGVLALALAGIDTTQPYTEAT